MAGHNKWSKIKRKKAVTDARRSKAWTMCLRAVMMAARSGGGDPEFNFALRTAIDEAKYHNVPKDNLERAIKKGAGGGEGESYEQGRYEGYGPGGVALIIDALTNNRTRTAADVRLILSKYGGNLGATGCVAFSFETKGRIVVSAPASAEETLFEVAAGAGADDIQFEDDDESPSFTVFTPVQAFNAVKQAIEQANLNITEARIEPIPTTTSAVSGDNAKQLLELVDALEDNDDIQKVYTNAEISDDVLAQM
ncbi:MAG TPA: YebC/PmpR family DNA-binding transcriptional regulator [Phycisphaerales bacterium]|jgi:YebC/PmpR family DNA-binding regulatory protein|nr:YebC/PmpR family DNA-binding transcriptional regulator [Phycisphaerales bacterium]